MIRKCVLPVLLVVQDDFKVLLVWCNKISPVCSTVSCSVCNDNVVIIAVNKWGLMVASVFMTQARPFKNCTVNSLDVIWIGSSRNRYLPIGFVDGHRAKQLKPSLFILVGWFCVCCYLTCFFLWRPVRASFLKGRRKKTCFVCVDSCLRSLNHLVFSSAWCQPSTVLVSCAFSRMWGRLLWTAVPLVKKIKY